MKWELYSIHTCITKLFLTVQKVELQKRLFLRFHININFSSTVRENFMQTKISFFVAEDNWPLLSHFLLNHQLLTANGFSQKTR